VFYDKDYEKRYVENGSESRYLKGAENSIYIVSEIQVTYKNKPIIYEVIYHMYHGPKVKQGYLEKKFLVFDIELDGVSVKACQESSSLFKRFDDNGAYELQKRYGRCQRFSRCCEGIF